MIDPIHHRCSCGREYTFAKWLELQLLGFNRFGAELVEWRQCECHSTLTRAAEPCDEVLAYAVQARNAKNGLDRAAALASLDRATQALMRRTSEVML